MVDFLKNILLVNNNLKIVLEIYCFTFDKADI